MFRIGFAIALDFGSLAAGAADFNDAPEIPRVNPHRRDLRQNATMGDDDPGDIFRIPDLWRPSELLDKRPDHAGFLFSELRLDSSSRS